jgi:Zn finger protein HypA/HybF involved in hydrogenase expression
MHEFSVALEICRLVEERLSPGESPHLRTVGVVVGEEAGLEPASLSFCLDALLAQPPFGAARAELIACPGPDLRVDFYEVDDDDPHD